MSLFQWDKFGSQTMTSRSFFVTTLLQQEPPIHQVKSYGPCQEIVENRETPVRGAGGAEAVPGCV